MITKVTKLNDDFLGEVNLQGKTYLVNNACLGETVDVVIDKKDAKIKRIIEASPSRIKPLCPIYEKCGGCRLLHINYQSQLELKHQKIVELFKKNGFKTPVEKVLGMKDPSHYRNKNQVVFGFDEKRRVVVGFYEEETHHIVNYEKCYIQDEYADAIINGIKELIIKMHLSIYNEDKRTGLIRHVMVKRSKTLNQTMVIVVTSSEVFPGRQNFIKALLASFKDITTIIQNVNSKKTTHVLGDKNIILFGKGYIFDELCGFKFMISPNSFYQVNPLQAKVLYEAALNNAHLSKEDVLLDAYSGVGTIGMIASPNVKKVISVELEASAVNDAIINAKNNNIKNVHCYCDDATRFINNLARKHEKIDVVVMDPPRKGSDEAFLKAVLSLKPKKIIYISCNPYTQVRDLQLLKNDYEIKFIQPVDMFPHTAHIECVVEIGLKDK